MRSFLEKLSYLLSGTCDIFELKMKVVQSDKQCLHLVEKSIVKILLKCFIATG